MILNILPLLNRFPLQSIFTLLSFSTSLVIAITVHEFSHAFAATMQGDNTARRKGRLSLNPTAHLDPVGTLLILIAGFGWGKPTPVNPNSLRLGTLFGMSLVAFAGPISNIMVASLFATIMNLGFSNPVPYSFALFYQSGTDIMTYMFFQIVFWNLALATFNLLPIAPLDGFKIVLGLLPHQLAFRFAMLEQYGPGILLSVIMLDFLFSVGILSWFIYPVLNVLIKLLLGAQVL